MVVSYSSAVDFTSTTVSSSSARFASIYTATVFVASATFRVSVGIPFAHDH